MRVLQTNRWIYALIIAMCAAPFATAVPRAVPTPIFNDPNYQGAADPEVVWNDHSHEWWIFYTARRIMAKVNPGCGGTPIGVCASKNLIDWRFVGYCKFDGIGGKKDSKTTRWAPGVIRDPKTGYYHMFVVYKPSNKGYWGGDSSVVRHYVAKDGDLLNGWTKVSDVTPPPQSIDPCLIRAKGQWWMFYRDIPKKDQDPGTVYWAMSPNLDDWMLQGQVAGVVNDRAINGASYQEGPYAFRWKGHYWLLTDQGGRLGQYRSDNLKSWTFTGSLLANPGWRPMDKNSGKHPSVAIIDQRAFIFYFNQPYAPANNSALERQKSGRSWLHMSELTIHDGKLGCDRNKLVIPPTNVTPSTPNAGRG